MSVWKEIGKAVNSTITDPENFKPLDEIIKNYTQDNKGLVASDNPYRLIASSATGISSQGEKPIGTALKMNCAGSFKLSAVRTDTYSSNHNVYVYVNGTKNYTLVVTTAGNSIDFSFSAGDVLTFTFKSNSNPGRIANVMLSGNIVDYSLIEIGE